MSYLLIRSDARRIPLRDASVHCVISSPPYFNLRDYGTGRWEGGDDPACDHRESKPSRTAHARASSGLEGSSETCHLSHVYRDLCPRCGARRVDRQIGLEKSIDAYVVALVAAFREVKRVLRDDGLCFLNLGDSFSGDTKGSGGSGRRSGLRRDGRDEVSRIMSAKLSIGHQLFEPRRIDTGLGPKQLLMVPHRVALALQADGWFLRDAIIWSKADMTEDLDIDGGVMPGSQRDRCTFAYEMLFMMAKRPRYYFDRDALRSNSGAILRNIWRLNTTGSKISHFALMPPEMARRCVLLATSERGCCPRCGAPWVRMTERREVALRPLSQSNRGNDASSHRSLGQPQRGSIACETRSLGWRPSCKCPEHVPVPCVCFDPFAGAGTTVLVATALGRHGIGCDLSHDYLLMARDRIDRPHKKAPRPAPADGDDLPLFRKD